MVDEIGDDFPAARRVDDFGMELQAEKFPGAIFDGRVFGIFRDGDRLEPVRQFRELVAVRIPDLQRFRQPAEQRARRVLHRERALAVFTLQALLDLAAEKLGEQLHAVADAEHGHAERENIFVRQRRVRGINAGRAAGQNDSARLQRGDFHRRRVVAQDDRIHVALADAARDDLRVLRPKIQNDDLFVHEINRPKHILCPYRAFLASEKCFHPRRTRLNNTRMAAPTPPSGKEWLNQACRWLALHPRLDAVAGGAGGAGAVSGQTVQH